MENKLKIRDIEEIIRTMNIEDTLAYLVELKASSTLNVEKLIQKFAKKNSAINAEKVRYDAMLLYEKESRREGFEIICGIDEVGRGPLAGPVVAAAVILPEGTFIEGINDSKKLSEKKREFLFDQIKEKALSYGIGIVDEREIDRINILNATRCAMKDAISKLEKEPHILLIDAERLQDVAIPQKSIIKGDEKSVSIAAASIIAKVTRDRMMPEFDRKYPGYGFAKNKGYGTSEHIIAIKKLGICPIHRISFVKNFV